MSNDKGIILQPNQSSMLDPSSRIYTIRGVQVMFDVDLADFYQVQTRILKRAVRANMDHFPDDFMFELTNDELEVLRSNFRISNIENVDLARSLRSKFRISNAGKGAGRGGNRIAPFAFTEPGVGMLSGILRTKRAAIVNVSIMRAFIHFRKNIELAQAHVVNELQLVRSDVADLKQRFEQLESFLRSRPQIPTSISEPPTHDRVALIQSLVARRWGLGIEDLISTTRMKTVALARHIAIFLIRNHLGLGLHEIGQRFGNRDHTTILHAYNKIRDDFEDRISIKRAIESLENEIQPLFA